MKTVEIGKHKVEFYDTIEDMPVERFHRLNRYLLVESGIGSSVEAVDQRLSQTIAFLKVGDRDSAIQELENLRQSVFLVCEGISPKDRAFAAIVSKIDGIPMQDMSEDGLDEVLRRLPELTIKELSQTIAEVKKKIEDEVELYFPSLFDNTSSIDYYNKLKQIALLRIEAVLTEIDNLANISKIALDIQTYTKPKNYIGTKGAEVQYDKQYEQMCLTISSELHSNAKQMTVKEFYTAHEYLIERSREMEKARKKNK